MRRLRDDVAVGNLPMTILVLSESHAKAVNTLLQFGLNTSTKYVLQDAPSLRYKVTISPILDNPLAPKVYPQFQYTRTYS